MAVHRVVIVGGGAGGLELATKLGDRFGRRKRAEITLLLVLLLTSKGAAGVTGSGFIVLAATLSAVGHVPVAGLALILGIDRFMSEARALTNLIGNGVATIVVAKWTDALDMERLQAGLNNETWIEAQEPEVLINARTEKMAS